MKWLGQLRMRVQGLTNSIARYPLTVVFLVAAAVLNAMQINSSVKYATFLWTCALGAVLSEVMQAAFERFAEKQSARLLLMGLAVVLTGGYYLVVRSAPELGMENEIRTSVALFALLIAYMWVPVIRSRISFNESFLAAFKAFFHSLFYSAVMMGGCSAILAAVDRLIYPIDSSAYDHVANLIFVLFAPIFFLSLIPRYPGKQAQENPVDPAEEASIARASDCPRFLEVLISYIIIPLTAIFTVILILYIALNIRGEFWTNNLLEPMLVSYAIVVILVYLLASRIENKFAEWFRRIFPKVLVPIVVFQIVSSVLSLQNTGVTHTRYFVILFGVFAASAGVVMSLVPVRKNGILAAMLIIFAAVSVIPPVDAFTISRISQTNQLKTVLTANGMLDGNTITPNGAISDTDKQKIVQSVEYLGQMGYTEQIAWLPADFEVYRDFYDTFGFNQYDLPQTQSRSVSVFLSSAAPVEIAGYDLFALVSISSSDDFSANTIYTMERPEETFRLTRERSGDQYDLVLRGADDREVIRFDTNEIFSRYLDYAMEKSELTPEEATFLAENDSVSMKIVVQNAYLSTWSAHTDYSADLYVLIRFP